MIETPVNRLGLLALWRDPGGGGSRVVFGGQLEGQPPPGPGDSRGRACNARSLRLERASKKTLEAAKGYDQGLDISRRSMN